jgi:hypothetical protein
MGQVEIKLKLIRISLVEKAQSLCFIVGSVVKDAKKMIFLFLKCRTKFTTGTSKIKK